jgi:hypothetical protein
VSVWEFRYMIESHIPLWVLIAVIIGFIMAKVIIFGVERGVK